jgi:hypothetical protein
VDFDGLLTQEDVAKDDLGVAVIYYLDIVGDDRLMSHQGGVLKLKILYLVLHLHFQKHFLSPRVES